MEHLWFIVYLFVISYLVIPFIFFYKSAAYSTFEHKLERFCKIPGVLLLFIIPILASQYVLLHFFSFQTMNLVDDWAYIVLSLIYFLFGFMLIGNSKIVSYLVRDRYWYLVLMVLTSILYFVTNDMSQTHFGKMAAYADTLLMSWLICLVVLGFGRKYLNRDHPWRRHLNQAIYPFYLLQQTVIVVLGYYIVGLNWSVEYKVLVLTVLCLLVIFLVYVFLILPFNFMRVSFGLKVVVPVKKNFYFGLSTLRFSNRK